MFLHKLQGKVYFPPVKLASKKKCTGCAVCGDACPKKAISMNVDEEGFLRPVINSDLCIGCERCKHVCPVLGAGKKDVSFLQRAFAARCKDEGIRENSSSGGIFSVLAKYVLAQKGVVYGCAFDEEKNAKHIRIDSMEGVQDLRGSKYLQSNTVGIYKQCHKDLLSGRKVLFSGTPCQVAALNHFLCCQFPNLLTVEVVCHGVPSPEVWQKFLGETFEGISKQKTWKISFRNKTKSWRRYSLTVEDESKEIYSSELSKNLYMQIFLKNLDLRPSCYSCLFKEGRSGADITLGDFWGIERLRSKLDDDKGVSAVILNSKQAVSIWEQCSNELFSEEYTLNDVVSKNPAYLTSPSIPSGRRKFMNNFQTMSLEKIYLKSVKNSLCVRGIKKVIRMLKKCLFWG